MSTDSDSSQSLADKDSEPFPAELADRPRGRGFGRWSGASCVLLVLALVLGPLLYVGLPREMARWRIAAALEKRLDGDLQGAIEDLGRALEQFPDDEQLYRQRADWLLEARQLERALSDADRAIELAPSDIRSYLVRSQILQRLDRHDDAVADWNRIVGLVRQGTGVSLAEALNGRAYARAVGNLELPEALEDVEEALQRAGNNAAMLDTRGYIHYLRGDYTAARSDLEKAVVDIEQDYETFSQLAEDRRLGVPDPRQFELDLKRQAEAVAVIRYHRALLFDQLDEPARAKKDRQRVRELGFEPNDALF
jgi:tetratricopeptide (TPR) repeat protein